MNFFLEWLDSLHRLLAAAANRRRDAKLVALKDEMRRQRQQSQEWQGHVYDALERALREQDGKARAAGKAPIESVANDSIPGPPLTPP